MAEPAEDPGSRRTLVVRAVTAHRREGGGPVVFTAGDATPDDSAADDPTADDPTVARLEYEDRVLVLDLSDEERERLATLLDDFPVFKVKQPETRKAPDGTVYVSAIADPKHLADFVEDCFRRVYDREEDYRLVAKG